MGEGRGGGYVLVLLPLNFALNWNLLSAIKANNSCKMYDIGIKVGDVKVVYSVFCQL